MLHVQFVQQNSSSLIFRTCRSGNDVTYSSHHNLNRIILSLYLRTRDISVSSIHFN